MTPHDIIIPPKKSSEPEKLPTLDESVPTEKQSDDFKLRPVDYQVAPIDQSESRPDIIPDKANPAIIPPNHKQPPGRLARVFSRFRGFINFVIIFAIAGLLALTLTTFVFQSFEVDGPSMETTLQDKDRLIVTKTGKTWAMIKGTDYIPNRYDIVVFDSTSSFGDSQKRQLIKRVIGVPGDRVVVKDDIVTIYNSDNPDGFDVDANQDYADSFGSTSGNVELTLDDGELFLLGDNRSNSLDSRNFGKVPTENVVGRLALRIYPLGNTSKF